MKKYTKAQSVAFTKAAKEYLAPLVGEVVGGGNEYPYWRAKMRLPSGNWFWVTMFEPDSGYSHSVFFRSEVREIHKQNFHAHSNEPDQALRELEAHVKDLFTRF